MYSKEVKNEVLNLINEGKSVKEVSEKYNISLTTIYKWKKLVDETVEQQDELIADDYLSLERINELIESGKIEIVLKNCKKRGHIIKIQTQRILNFVKNGNYEEALNICDLEDLKNNIQIQKQKILILVEIGKITEALDVCKVHESNIDIQMQRISILLQNKNYEEALKVCELENIKNNSLVLERKINILMILERYEEALEIASQKELKKCKRVQIVRKKLLKTVKSICKNVEPRKDVSVLYTRIYLNDISLEEINNSNIDEFDKVILKVLYYEKNNLSGVLNVIKEAKKVYNSYQQKEALNKLYRRFESKKIYYLDYSIYSGILNCTLNDKMIEEYNGNKALEKTVKKVVLQPVVKKKEVEKQSQIKYVIPKPIVKKSVVASKVQTVVTPKVEKKQKNNLDVSKIRILDIFKEEIEEIKKYLYVEMNRTQSKKIIDIYDRFCILIEKSITDYNALYRFIEFAIYVDKLSTFTSINIDNLEVKKLKYIKPSNN